MNLLKRAILSLASIPIGLFSGLLLTLCDAAALLRHRVGGNGRASAKSSPSLDLSVSIIVLNWDGRPLLEESLPALQDALHDTQITHEVVVVDNGSSDDSVAFVERQFPHYRIVRLPANLGFGEGNNAGVRAARCGLVLLLNNDVLVERNFLEPLVEAMSPSTFAVTSQVFLPPDVRREETGKTVARFRHGCLELSHEEITPSDRTNGTVAVFWAGGGSSLYRKDLFLELGGFDSLFSPSYAEDADLSFRAWQAGYKSVLATASHVLHKHKSSTRRRFGESGAQNLMHAHIRLFFLKNFSLRRVWSYFLWLPANSWANLEFEALARALRKWPLLLARRMARKRPVLSEEDILGRAGTPVAEEMGSGLRNSDLNSEDLTPSLLNPQSAFRIPHSETPNPQSNKRLQILYVSAYVPHLWRHGGAGRVFQLIKRVAKQHDVSVAAFYEDDAELKECENLRSFSSQVIPVYRRGKPATNIFPYEPFEEFDLPEMRQALIQAARERPFDIVHFEYTQMASYADLFPNSVKFLTEVEVNYGAAASKISYLSSPLKRFKWYYNSMQVLDRELALCRLVDHVVCVNETDAALLRGYLNPSAVHVVHTGVDIEYFKPNGNYAEEPFSVGFVAAFRHEPNVDAAIFFINEVLPAIKKPVPETRFYLIGSSPPEEVRTLHDGKHVFVTGFVQDLLQYYHRMSVIVVPLRIGVGIRGKILEAWAAGKPVVGTTLAAAGIEAHQGENIYIADSPAELARWTVRLLGNQPARASMGVRGRRTAELFYNWDQLAQRLCELYSRCIH
ncbi:MAG TPA: glycosyltransferase [Acidobacteriota bacterium]|jgi:GT2 family glycosyltransferase/glycosyltransferase involved in cell wall biosynthesis